uniref:leucine-rich repeat domain-containing protein n=1 Tax=Fulvivirga sp. TaxID=1931237 RepID=UPI004048FFFD
MKSYLILAIAIFFVSCSRDYYKFNNEKFLWHKDLNKALKHPNKILALDLSNQGLTGIPSEVSEFNNLQFLSLTENDISQIPEFIYNNDSIRGLFFYANENLKLSSSIGGMTNLSVLEVIRCGLDSLPVELFELKDLKHLGISGNNLTMEQIEMIKTNLPNCKVMYSID